MAQPDHIDSKGNKYWFNIKGEMHRVGGPALEYADGSQDFFINGVMLTLDEFLAHKYCKLGKTPDAKQKNTYVSPFTGKIK